MKGPQTEKIRALFDSIAKDYDKLNHILSLGVDKTWRKRAIKVIAEDRPQQILDIACGTGDFSIEIARHTNPATTVTGLDLSDGMLEVMDRKVAQAGLSGRISTQQGNSEAMSFEDCSFDRVTIAFGIRNFENRETALKEILRVLKPGGRLVILELSVPSNPVLRWCYELYFTKVLPWIGGVVSGEKAAYSYLPASVIKFPGKAEWMAIMSSCGYREVKHKAFTFGICRMYTGEK
ncbi:MAG: bifunctional demethylmenaquinone methyltransferase/2-methoxy-6-polyprenyl-1,4-benzoquinol methylase UbiE [Bacteroidales bacterium]|nr:bifunctional demethylmenaquinone methyltransferase/2-methoxy-6-polyprenyl-1,4-benzoquinol methylase UbiE [Candidatus Cryptobacteroides caccocaballi]